MRCVLRVAVAMSGGTDSTASALLLKGQGHEVLGLHMILYSRSESSWETVRRIGKQIEVPVHRVDLKDDFARIVVEHFVQEYSGGRTPSPCLICNREIKMSLLWKSAASLGCDKLATGHYARVETTPAGPILLKGLDRKKDQSYFLALLTREMLARAVFPLGSLTKEYAREFLRLHGVTAAYSSESQELCFVPDGDYRAFLKKMGFESRPGLIKDLTNNVLGTHSGIEHFTVGQRRGLGISTSEARYVVSIDPESCTVFVGPKEKTYVSRIKISDINILQPNEPSVGDRFEIKVRSTTEPVPCTLASHTSEEIAIELESPQSGVAPGQAAVLYSGDRVAFGGWIRKAW